MKRVFLKEIAKHFLFATLGVNNAERFANFLSAGHGENDELKQNYKRSDFRVSQIIMIWYNIEDNPPIATKTGHWDGLKTDKILVATLNGGIYVAEMYEGIQDGQKFRDFFDPDDFEITNVVKWTKIESPF